MSFVEQQDQFGRTVLISVLVWGTVAGAALIGLRLALPDRAIRTLPSESQCIATVPSGPYIPLGFDLATAVVNAPSRCTAHTAGTDPIELVHAYLEGAELDGAPRRPSPAVDATLRARGADLYERHCANCHGETGDGAGPDACALDTPPAIHNNGVYSLRTTEHEALPTDADIFRTITRGVHGTAMPPWIILPEKDRWALVAHVKSLSTQFDEDVAPPPVEVEPAPEATPERLAAGYALYSSGGCASCHGVAGEGDGLAAGALHVKPRNFTRGRFHRGSSVADIHETLMTGFDGTPMASFAKVMSPDDLWNVSLLVHSITPNMNDRNGIRCAEIVRPFDTQELFGVRNMMRTMQLRQFGVLEVDP